VEWTGLQRRDRIPIVRYPVNFYASIASDFAIPSIASFCQILAAIDSDKPVDNFDGVKLKEALNELLAFAEKT
jgi:hypothetical protein